MLNRLLYPIVVLFELICPPTDPVDLATWRLPTRLWVRRRPGPRREGVARVSRCHEYLEDNGIARDGKPHRANAATTHRSAGRDASEPRRKLNERSSSWPAAIATPSPNNAEFARILL